MKLTLSDDNGRQVMAVQLSTQAALELSAALSLEVREEMRRTESERAFAEDLAQMGREFAQQPEEGRRIINLQNSGRGKFEETARGTFPLTPEASAIRPPVVPCKEDCPEIGSHVHDAAGGVRSLPGQGNPGARAVPGDRLQ